MTSAVFCDRVCCQNLLERNKILCRFDARAIGFGDDLYVFGGLRRLECPSAYHTGSGMKFCYTEVYSTEQQVHNFVDSKVVSVRDGDEAKIFPSIPPESEKRRVTIWH